jgi:NhaP-type Na+/H+ or K+/H+ antiporter
MPFFEPVLAAEPGFSLGDGYVLALLFAGVALFAAVVALSQQHERAFSAAVVYLVLGAVASIALELGGTHLIEPLEDTDVLERVSEFAVIVALFSAGLKIDRPLRWGRWRSATLLLAIVMPLTMVGVTLLGVHAMGLSLGAAVLLAAILAPTDPVLASDVSVGPPGEKDEDEDEPEPAFALTAEAGLNDGLAFPFVFLGIFIAGEGGSGWLGEWLAADVLYAIAVGIGLGALAGRLIAAAVLRLRNAELLHRELDGWLAVATVLAVYGLVEAVGGYGFLAAFTGGLAFRRYERDHEYNARVHAGAELVEKFAEIAAVLLLGSTVTLVGLGEPGLAGWLTALAVLFVIRPLAALLALLPTGISRGEASYIGWFGIRGVGSFYYVAVALGAGVLTAAEATTLYWTVVVCVGVSIVVHGITATPLTKRLPQAGRSNRAC